MDLLDANSGRMGNMRLRMSFYPHLLWIVGFSGILVYLLVLPIFWEILVADYPELVIAVFPWLCFLCIFSFPGFVVAGYYGFCTL